MIEVVRRRNERLKASLIREGLQVRLEPGERLGCFDLLSIAKLSDKIDVSDPDYIRGRMFGLIQSQTTSDEPLTDVVTNGLFRIRLLALQRSAAGAPIEVALARSEVKAA